jgi:clan AA aspartic protease (TIGR02281 family)
LKLHPIFMKRISFSKTQFVLFCLFCFPMYYASGQNLIRDGFTAMNKQDYDAAYRKFGRAVKQFPDSALAFYGLGLMEEFYEKDTGKALTDYIAATQLEPRFARAFKEIGRIKYKKREYYSALQNCNQAIANDPGSAGAYNIRGLTYTAMHSYDDALVDFSKALVIIPNFAEVYLNRGIVEKALKQYRNAMSDISHAVELQPGYYYDYFDFGEDSPELRDINDTIRIQMTRRDSMYFLPVTLDGVKEQFMLDFGNSALTVPQYIYDDLLAKGTLDGSDDFIRNSGFRDVSSSNLRAQQYSLKTLRLDNKIFFNVPLSIFHSDNGYLLMGGEILRRFNKVIIDNRTFVLTLIRHRNYKNEGNEQDRRYSYYSRRTNPSDHTRNAGGSNSVYFWNENNRCGLSVSINGEEVNAILDTGAKYISIPQDFADYLKRNGEITDDDYIRETSVIAASGNQATASYVRLRNVKIGNRVLNNVVALIVHSAYNEILLGETTLVRFNKITVDYDNNRINFE